MEREGNNHLKYIHLEPYLKGHSSLLDERVNGMTRNIHRLHANETNPSSISGAAPELIAITRELFSVTLKVLQ